MTTTTATREARAQEKAGAEVGTGVVVWLHEDHLSAANPALTRYPEAPVIFVFDEAFLPEEGLSFHRLFFIYESVMDVFAARAPGSCQIRRGSVAGEIADFAAARGAKRVVTTDTIGDRFAECVTEIEAKSLPVEAIPVPSLVPYDSARAPKRFSSWWREVEAEALGG